jgi:hypothetical protein
LLTEFLQPSVLVDDDPMDNDVDNSVDLIDVMYKSPLGSPTSLHPPIRHLSLYESSLFDVVDAIESSETRASPKHSPARRRHRATNTTNVESPTLRVEKLTQGLRLREEKVARVPRRTLSGETSMLEGVELFNDVKDVYTQELENGRRDDVLRQHQLDPIHTSNDAIITRDIHHVRAAIERDMEEFLKREGMAP